MINNNKKKFVLCLAIVFSLFWNLGFLTANYYGWFATEYGPAIFKLLMFLGSATIFLMGFELCYIIICEKIEAKLKKSNILPSNWPAEK